MQLQSGEPTTIADDTTLVFDTILEDQSLNINYNTGTGVFTINAAGNYFVDWSVNTDGAEAAIEVTFGLSLNDGPAVENSSPILTGQLNGSALIVVGATPATLELVNTTGATVNIPNTTVQANLVIVELSA